MPPHYLQDPMGLVLYFRPKLVPQIVRKLSNALEKCDYRSPALRDLIVQIDSTESMVKKVKLTSEVSESSWLTLSKQQRPEQPKKVTKKRPGLTPPVHFSKNGIG